LVTLGNSLSRYGLAIHTTSPQLGLALDNRQGDRSWHTWDLDRDLSNSFHSCLQEFLGSRTWQDLEWIAVAKGPGSFTSTRIGIVTARTLAQQFALPVYTVSSLAAYAWSEREHYPEDTYLALQMPATRGQWYTGIYRGNTCYQEDILVSADRWQERLDRLTIPYQRLETPSDLGFTAPDVLDLAYLERQTGKIPLWTEALPFYGT
jgi:tRNA threonylcarbamoyladenosine biosynthesis protein TsaB